MNDILREFSLKGKIAVITGTTRGLGQSLAEGLVEAGATVVALDRSENDKLPKAFGNQFKRIKIDLLKASKKELEEVIDAVVKEFSRIDILVNNAES